jgi:hypothetical protein
LKKNGSMSSCTFTVHTKGGRALKCDVITHHNTFYAMTFLKKQAVIKIIRIRKHTTLPSPQLGYSLDPETMWLHHLHTQSPSDETNWEVDEDDPTISRKHIGVAITLEDYERVSSSQTRSSRRDIYRPGCKSRKKYTATDYTKFIQDFVAAYSSTFDASSNETHEIVWREIGTNDWFLWTILN